jgi:acid stress chaperone HdeB
MRLPLIMLIVITLASPARSQMILDVSKITCDQYVHSKIATPNYIAAWMSGYFSAKRNDLMLDIQALQERVSKLERFCYDEKNFQIPVMKAIERLFPSSKG